MTENHSYRGHRICLQLLQIQPERYRWVWRIDGAHTAKGRAVFQTEDVARSEALQFAQLTIESIEQCARPLVQ